MATTLSRNLKLRIDSNLTANAKYNLERLDLLGANIYSDSTDTLRVRSRGDVIIEPKSPDVDGSGIGGTVVFGTASHELDSVTFYSEVMNVRSPLSLLDQATGGNKYLQLRYKSDVSGSVDTAADRVLSLDLNGADRSLSMAGDLSFVGGNITLTTVSGSSVTVPATGTLATLDGAETLTNKSIDASLNTITNLTNSSISSSAAIAGTKISPDFGTQNIRTSGQLRLASGSYYSSLQAGTQSANISYTLPTSVPTGSQLLRTNALDPFQLEWASVGTGLSQAVATWAPGDGTTKVVNHGLGSSAIDVVIIDDLGHIVGVDSIVVTDSNNITLTSSESPAANWTVVVQGN